MGVLYQDGSAGCGMRAWTNLVQDRAGGGSCECGNESTCSIKCDNF